MISAQTAVEIDRVDPSRPWLLIVLSSNGVAFATHISSR